jgi:3-deoxy-manno-octulosonate cytidylyltransferase (CMP-KDO synthetase)
MRKLLGTLMSPGKVLSKPLVPPPGSMKITAFIPARYQSRRFPGKPLALIAGKPMIQHVYERASRCPELTQVYVATDHDAIFDRVEAFGGKAVMTRSDHHSGTDRVCEAAGKVGLAGEDIIVNIQGDQPIFNPAMISTLLAPLLEDSNTHMTTLMHKIHKEEDIRNPNHVKVVTDNGGYALYFSRCPIPFFRDRNGFGKTHFRHLGFYAYRKDFLVQFTNLQVSPLESSERLEQLRALEYGFRIKVQETPYASLDVDVPEDIERVEKALKKSCPARDAHVG